jgi:hypothetical protein
VSGLTLETPGYLPFAHGYHHEFAMLRPNAWLDAQLGLCFCEHCRAGAAAAGIAVDPLRRRIAAAVESYLESGIDLPEDMASAMWRADLAGDAELSAFLRWRADVVTSLVAEIRAAVRPDCAIAIIPSVARPTAGAFYEGSDLAALADAAGILEACFYEPDVARIAADAWDVRRRIGPSARLRGVLRPSFPDLESGAAVAAAVTALKAAGIADVAFYNYGFLREPNLAWIAAALAG